MVSELLESGTLLKERIAGSRITSRSMIRVDVDVDVEPDVHVQLESASTRSTDGRVHCG